MLPPALTKTTVEAARKLEPESSSSAAPLAAQSIEGVMLLQTVVPCVIFCGEQDRCQIDQLTLLLPVPNGCMRFSLARYVIGEPDSEGKVGKPR